MPELVIEAGRTEKYYWHDLWRYRELFLFLAWRDILVRYKQTVIGIAWAIVRPALTTLVFTVVFGRIARLSSPTDVPYSLLVLAAILPWQFFATALGESSHCLIGNANLISKIYFPRLIVPASSVMTSFVDFLITLALMGLLMIWYQFVPDWRLLLLPAFSILAFFAAFGAGLWLCALNVEYRDFRYVVPFLVQLGAYLSPVGFTSTVVPQKWHLLYSINPMVAVIDGFRWSLLRGRSLFNPYEVLLSVGLIISLSLSGISYFRRVERRFADII